MTLPSPRSTPAALTSPEEHQALLAASRALLLPLARLLVARGVPYAQAEESLKTAMRRIGSMHCILAYLFNTTVLALLINIGASLF